MNRMSPEFEAVFEEKFGQTFSSESMKFLHKSIMYEGWLIAINYIEDTLATSLKEEIEQNKGE